MPFLDHAYKVQPEDDNSTLYVLCGAGIHCENGQEIAVQVGADPATTAAPTTCVSDISGDGLTGLDDLATLLVAWGICPTNEPCPADIVQDGFVGLDDLSTLLVRWGPC